MAVSEPVWGSGMVARLRLWFLVVQHVHAFFCKRCVCTQMLLK